ADGDRYLKTAVNGYRNRPAVFTPEIVYNLVGMAIEKHVMGVMLHDKKMPDNHTLTDLVHALEELCDVDRDLYDRILNMDRFQEICSLAAYRREPPAPDDVPEFLDVGTRVQALVNERLPSESAPPN
ncbi:MAG: hypothetical protein ACLFPR_15935, partial [Desulfococcaceae bacterium]